MTIIYLLIVPTSDLTCINGPECLAKKDLDFIAVIQAATVADPYAIPIWVLVKGEFAFLFV